MNKYINAKKVAEENNLYLKVVTSVKSFDNYNSFFNIYDECEEPCRRIVVLTRNKLLEEVYDENSFIKIEKPIIIDDNLWIKDYDLLVNPDKINLDKIEILSSIVDKYLLDIKCM